MANFANLLIDFDSAADRMILSREIGSFADLHTPSQVTLDMMWTFLRVRVILIQRYG